MNIKKMLLSLGCSALLIGAVSASASEKVIIPDYECIIFDASVYYADSEYPLLNYRDITYFPMTYDYCRALNLASSWVEGKGLYIAYVPFGTNDALPLYPTVANTKVNDAVIPEYPIYINGKLIDNKNADYPLLNFRGVTYFPMTYDFAVNEFNWKTDWQAGIFTISKNNAYGDTCVSVREMHPDYAVIGYYTSHEIQNPDGSFSSGETTCAYKKLDYKTGEMTDLSDYADPDYDAYYHPGKSVTLNVDKENKKVYYNDFLLAEVNGCFSQDESEFKTSGITANGIVYNINGVEFLDVEDFFSGWREDGSGLRTRDQNLYLLDNGKPVYIGSSYLIDNAEKLGDDVYFSLKGYVQTLFKHIFSSHELYRYSGGTLTKLNDEFPDFGSVTLLGKAEEKLYLKCEWCPEALIESQHNISPANDGYFTYDGENLTKVANYIYTDSDLLGENGEIYGIIDWKVSIIKIK